ncbi:hypothetical protein V8G54_018932 [Vigna mungo]|uniref:Uncharacterized protein n=1 Tax=Vigna mungo TaxID=3915 RepID=A0AAQ3NB30_VIGMU
MEKLFSVVDEQTRVLVDMRTSINELKKSVEAKNEDKSEDFLEQPFCGSEGHFQSTLLQDDHQTPMFEGGIEMKNITVRNVVKVFKADIGPPTEELFNAFSRPEIRPHPSAKILNNNKDVGPSKKACTSASNNASTTDNDSRQRKKNEEKKSLGTAQRFAERGKPSGGKPPGGKSVTSGGCLLGLELFSAQKHTFHPSGVDLEMLLGEARDNKPVISNRPFSPRDRVKGRPRKIKFVPGAQDHREIDKEGELFHQHPDVKSDKPKPDIRVKFKNRLWVVKTIKANRALLRLEIVRVGDKKFQHLLMGVWALPGQANDVKEALAGRIQEGTPTDGWSKDPHLLTSAKQVWVRLVTLNKCY